MSSDVTRDGLVGVRPGREALTGSDGGRRAGRNGKKGRGAETPMVPDAEFSSYYGKPIINQPTWESPDIPGYLYLGGLAGASSVMALGAHLTGRRSMRRSAKVTAAAGIGLSMVALVHDLGRPERFVNMLRVFKPSSPMSVGSWLLSGYGPLAVAAAGSEITGLLPRLGTAATAGAAVVGPAVAAYTAALISNTAVPAWHDGHRHMPFVFVSSAATAAAGAALIGSPVSEAAPARRLALAAVASEAAVSEAMTRSMGLVGEAYKTGEGGRYLRAAKVLNALGTAGTVLFARRSRLAAMASGSCLMAASACTRWGVFEAGISSANDPSHTVVPQRRRAESQGSSKVDQATP